MRCPRCGARNTAEAAWCTQCLEPFTTPPSDSSDPSEPAPVEPPAEQAETPPDAASPPAPASPPDVGRSQAAVGRADSGADRPFRTVDGEVEWRCPGCDTWNLLDVRACSVCGHRLASAGGNPDRFADRVARARRPLWALALLGGVVMIGSVILLLLALRGGAGA